MIIKTPLLSLIFILLSSNTFATNDKPIEIIKVSEKIKPKIIDEADKKTPERDTIKGGGKLKDIIKDINISLSSMGKYYQIDRKDLYYPPYKCFIHHKEGQDTKIGINKNNSFNFKIKKSLLTEGDVIVITNNIENNSPFKNVIIEWVEIIK